MILLLRLQIVAGTFIAAATVPAFVIGISVLWAYADDMGGFTVILGILGSIVIAAILGIGMELRESAQKKLISYKENRRGR